VNPATAPIPVTIACTPFAVARLTLAVVVLDVIRVRLLLALGHLIFAPRAANLRLIAMPDADAKRVWNWIMAMAVATAVAVGEVLLAGPLGHHDDRVVTCREALLEGVQQAAGPVDRERDLGHQAEVDLRVRERGVRGDERVEGHGLGLAIVLELANAYGGRVDIGDSDLGGARITVELPGD